MKEHGWVLLHATSSLPFHFRRLQVRRTRHELYKFIDADYYGFRDEEDGVLAAVEGPAQEAMRNQVRDQG